MVVETNASPLAGANPDTFVPPEAQPQPFQVAGLGSTLFKAIAGAKVVRAPARKKQPLVVQKPEPKKVPEPEGQKDLDLEVDEASEAERVGQLNFRDVDKEGTHQPNFDFIETEDDLKAVIADMANRNKSKIDNARRNVVTNAELKGLAGDLDLQEDVVREIMTRESGGILNAETILASRQVLNSSAQRILDLGELVRKGDATDTEKLAFRRQMEFHRQFQTQFMGARAEIGRALQQFRIPAGTDPTQVARMSELIETMNGNDIRTIATQMENIDTIQGLNKVVREYKRSKVAGALQELWINSILSGVKTQVVNLSGNALFQTMGAGEAAAAGIIGQGRAKLSAAFGRPISSEEHALIGEASARVFGMVTGIRDASRMAWKSLRTGEASDAVHKLEMPRRAAISSEALELSGPLGRAADLIGTLIRFPTERVLTGGDEFFKATAYRAELSAQAYREAASRVQRGELTPDQYGDFVRSYMESPPVNAMKQAEDDALYRTFQNPLGTTGRNIQGVVNRTPGLKYLAPFIRTPTNIFKAGLVERTPLGLFSARIRETIAAGGPEADLALARISMGSMTALSVAAYVGSGQMTGGGPSNHNARKALEATGWQRYSIVSENDDGSLSYQSYARAEPLAFILGATADMVEIYQYSDNLSDDELVELDKKIENVSAAIVAGIAENTMSKTFVRGLGDFNNMMSDPRRYMKSWSANLGKGFIPFSALQRDLERVKDPVVREGWTMIDKVKRDMPFLSGALPPKLDLYGEMVFHPRGSVLGIFSPFPGKKGTTDPVKLEVARVMEHSKMAPMSMPNKFLSGVRLDTAQYHRLVKLSRKELTDSEGRTFHQSLKTLFNSSIYEDLTPDMKAITIRQVTDGYNQLGRNALLEEDEDLLFKVNRREALQLRNKFGAENLPGSVQDVLDQPTQ